MPQIEISRDTALTRLDEPMVALEQARQTLELLQAAYPRPTDKARLQRAIAVLDEAWADLAAERADVKADVVLSHVVHRTGTTTFLSVTEAEAHAATLGGVSMICQSLLSQDAARAVLP